jgi:pimeloyl-ACP methyl ester carboxylesterase
MDATAITHRSVDVHGLRIHLAEAGPADGPVVLLLHGFPECWYSWRHQLVALATAGFHAIAPDQRGYARSDAPDAVEAYTILHLVGDAVGVLDTLGADRAVVVGHDWGAPVAWHTALLRPDRVRGVVGLSVPYRSRGPARPTDALAHRFGPGYYMLHFQTPGVADAELVADPRATFRRLLSATSGGAPPPLPVLEPGGGFLDFLRRRVPRPRLHGRAQLVSQPRPQLGAHRRVARRPDHPARAVPRRRTGPRDRRRPGRRPRRLAATHAPRPARRHPAARLRALDPAGTAGGGQRRDRRVRRQHQLRFTTVLAPRPAHSGRRTRRAGPGPGPRSSSSRG